MIGFYNQTIPGTSHIEEGTQCQDANGVTRLENGWIIAAVAKGISGTMNSAVAASVAVDTSIRFLKDHSELIASLDDESLNPLFNLSFIATQKKLEFYAEINGSPPEEYDTTLTLAIYDGKRVAYGHSGYGGGIITLDEHGAYRRLTPVQIADTHDEKFSLRTGRERWSFGFSGEERVCSILLATDGVFDVFCPQILAMMSNPIDIYEVRGHMDTGLWKFNTVAEYKSQKKLFKEILREKFPNVTDDKTLVLIVNTEILPEVKNDRYYAKTDFEEMSGCESNLLYYGTDGKEYLLEDKILDIDADNSTIYSVYNNSEIFVVIYDDLLGKVVSQLSKIASVLDTAASNSASKLLDVPAVLYDRDEIPRGYVKLIGRGDIDYDKFCMNPAIDWKQRLKVAINLTVALDRLHNAGLVVGNLAPVKIGIDSNGLVHLSNCESYIVRNAKKSDGFKFDSSRVDIVYMAPEIRSRIDSPFLYYRFSVESDLYSLAFLIYRLLTFGRHPFTSSGGDDNNKSENRSINKIKGLLPEKIVSLFERAFISGKSNPKARPSVSEWYFALLNEYDSLIQCKFDKKHYYGREFTECPWCKLEGGGARSPEDREDAEGKAESKAKGRSNKSGKSDKTKKSGKSVKSSKTKDSTKSAKSKETDKSPKTKKPDMSDTSEKSDNAEKSGKAGKSDKSDKTKKSKKK